MHGPSVAFDRLHLNSHRLPARTIARTPRGDAGRILCKGEHLHHAGDLTPAPYIVISGALKGYSIDTSGNESVVRLYSEGDALGLEAFAQRPALTSVVALTTSQLWMLSEHAFSTTEPASQPAPNPVLVGIYQEFRQATEALEMNRGPTDARLARFLLQYGHKQTLRGCKRDEFLLPFGRRDLAHYLGLATETLSRVFARLQHRGILDVDNHHIVILDPEALRHVASKGT